jgi:uncharacterized oligopeptide transporter (OPT) family protein
MLPDSVEADIMAVQEESGASGSSKPRIMLVAAWVTTLVATVTYVAVAWRFEWTSVLASVFAVVSLAVVAYWLPGEPRWPPDDIDLPEDPLAGEPP